MPQASTSIMVELTDETPSTTIKRSPERATAASSRSGLQTPVEVSLCVRNTSSASG